MYIHSRINSYSDIYMPIHRRAWQMTLEQQIENIEESIFLLDMKDTWSDEDREEYHRLNKKLKELKGEK